MPNYDSRIRLQTIRMADVSLNKMTQINERFRLQFRVEAFNIANSFFVTRAMFNATPDNANFGVAVQVHRQRAAFQLSAADCSSGIKLLW